MLGVDDSCGTAGGKAPNACLNDTIVAVTEGSSSAPEVAVVDRADERGVYVKALAAGEATISARVETRDTIGRTHHERVRVTISVEAPDRMMLNAYCYHHTGTRDMNNPQVVVGAELTSLTITQAAFVTGDTPELEVDAKRGDRSLLLEGAPQEVLFTLVGDPAAPSVADVSDPDRYVQTTRRFVLTKPETPSNITLRSGFDDTVHTFRVASPDQIDSVTIHTSGAKLEPELRYGIQGTVSGTPLCHPQTLKRVGTLSTSTPEVCAPVQDAEEKSLSIETLKAGTCRASVTIGGKTLPLEFEVAPGA